MPKRRKAPTQSMCGTSFKAEKDNRLVGAEQPLQEFTSDQIAAIYARFFESLLPELEERFLAGDGRVLLETIYHCFEFNIPIPTWARVGFTSRYQKIKWFDTGSLDEAFGRPLQTNKQIHSARTKNLYFWRVVFDIAERRRQGAVTGEELWDSVGSKWGLSGSTVRRWYYEFKRDPTRVLNFP